MKHIKINQLLYVVSLALFIFFTSTILLLSIHFDNAEFFKTFLFGYKVPVVIIVCAALLFVALYTLINLFQRFFNKGYVPYILLFIIFILQVIFVFYLKASLRYDTLKVFDQGIALLNGEVLSPEYSSGYFAKYPNNIPICIATALLLKLPKLFGMNENYYMLYVQFINVVLMNLAFFFSFQLIQRVKNKTTGIIFLLLVLFNPLTYLIAPFYYTHTFSMAFSTGALYFFVCCLQEKDSKKKQLLYAALTGLLLAVGFKIRATVFIVAIAMFIYLLLNIKLLSKKSFLTFIVFLASATLSLGAYQLAQQHYVKFDYRATGYPATHWLMLGMQGTGGYNAADDAYTESFATKKERTKATEAMIIQRVNQMRVPGLLKLWRDKLEITWSDATDDFIDNISMTKNYSAINDYISGSNNDILVVYCHIYYFMVLLLVFISTIHAFLQKPNHYLYFVLLNVLGGIVFHMLWEAGEVYSISFSCSMFILASNGFYQCREVINTRLKPTMRIGLASGTTILGLLCIFYIGSKLTTIPYTHYNYAAKQDLAEPDTTLPLLKNTLCQTFTTSRPFNTIGVKVRNSLGSDNCSSYQFQLLNDKNEILQESEIIGAWAFDKDYYRIEFNTITPSSNEEFKIKIIPNIVSDAHYLTFQSYNTGNYDIYQNGILYENDKPTKGDLTFMVIEKIDKPFW